MANKRNPHADRACDALKEAFLNEASGDHYYRSFHHADQHKWKAVVTAATALFKLYSVKTTQAQDLENQKTELKGALLALETLNETETDAVLATLETLGKEPKHETSLSFCISPDAPAWDNPYTPPILPIDKSHFKQKPPQQPLPLFALNGKQIYHKVFACIIPQNAQTERQAQKELFDILANYVNESFEKVPAGKGRYTVKEKPVSDKTHEALRLRVEYQGYGEQADDIIRRIRQYLHTEGLFYLLQPDDPQQKTR